MIRFVEMIGIDPLSEKPTHFCFWDTVRDTFVVFVDELVFSSVSDFREKTAGLSHQNIINRCERLIPDRWKT